MIMKNSLTPKSTSGDMELLNRENFRPMLQAMSRPGTPQSFNLLNGSEIMAAAALLLYPEVNFHSTIPLDWSLIEAITGSTSTTIPQADYLFCSEPCHSLLEEAKCGTASEPEGGATMIIEVTDFSSGTPVLLSGSGINGQKHQTLPVSAAFLKLRGEKNRHFPVGIDLFFLSNTKEVMGLPRSTTVEIL